MSLLLLTPTPVSAINVDHVSAIGVLGSDTEWHVAVGLASTERSIRIHQAETRGDAEAFVVALATAIADAVKSKKTVLHIESLTIT